MSAAQRHRHRYRQVDTNYLIRIWKARLVSSAYAKCCIFLVLVISRVIMVFREFSSLTLKWKLHQHYVMDTRLVIRHFMNRVYLNIHHSRLQLMCLSKVRSGRSSHWSVRPSPGYAFARGRPRFAPLARRWLSLSSSALVEVHPPHNITNCVSSVIIFFLCFEILSDNIAFVLINFR